MINQIAEKLKGTCRWYDIIESAGSAIPINFKNNRLYSVQEKQNSGFGIRVNHQGRTGFSYTNDPDRIEGAVNRALDLAPYGDEENFDLPSHAEVSFEPYDEKISSFSIDEEIARGSKSVEYLLNAFPEASVDLSIGKSIGVSRLINSKGIDADYRNSYYSAGVSITLVMEDGVKVDVWEGASFQSSSDYSFLLERVREKCNHASVLCGCESGTMPVLFTPKAASRMMGIVAAGLNARSVWKGISPFADKLGQKVFSESLTVYDDPTVQGSPYSYPFDDEGTAACRKAIIEKGVVANFVTDLKHAVRLNIEPLGNASRGYSTLPYPSFSNVLVEQGPGTLSGLMGAFDRIIMVDQLIGLGQSNTLTGEFSASLDLAFLVEKGAVSGRVKDCMISGNLFNILKEEILFSSERDWSGSTLAPYMLLPSVNFTSQ